MPLWWGAFLFSVCVCVCLGRCGGTSHGCVWLDRSEVSTPAPARALRRPSDPAEPGRWEGEGDQGKGAGRGPDRGGGKPKAAALLPPTRHCPGSGQPRPRERGLPHPCPPLREVASPASLSQRGWGLACHPQSTVLSVPFRQKAAQAPSLLPPKVRRNRTTETDLGKPSPQRKQAKRRRDLEGWGWGETVASQAQGPSLPPLPGEATKLPGGRALDALTVLQGRPAGRLLACPERKGQRTCPAGGGDLAVGACLPLTG